MSDDAKTLPSAPRAGGDRALPPQRCGCVGPSFLCTGKRACAYRWAPAKHGQPLPEAQQGESAGDGTAANKS